MKKEIIIGIGLCFITLLGVNAQVFDTPYGTRQFTNDLYLLDEYIKRQSKGVDFKDTDSYKGTPYNHPSYLPGNVYKNDELMASNVALRYNAIADEMEIKESLGSSDDDARVLTKSPDIFVKIRNDICNHIGTVGMKERLYLGAVFHIDNNEKGASQVAIVIQWIAHYNAIAD